MKKLYRVDIWAEGIFVDASDLEDAFEKAKNVVLRSGLSVSVDRCLHEDEEVSDEAFDECEECLEANWDLFNDRFEPENPWN
jgi:hypothetical protein